MWIVKNKTKKHGFNFPVGTLINDIASSKEFLEKHCLYCNGAIIPDEYVELKEVWGEYLPDFRHPFLREGNVFSSEDQGENPIERNKT
jgi:hypothetical protein